MRTFAGSFNRNRNHKIVLDIMAINISAINGLARKSLIGAALAGSMFLGASSPIKNTRAEREPQRTEVMSKESAEALKLNSLQQTQQTVPTVHNKKLDDSFKLFASTDDDIKLIDDFTSNLYNGCGTYLASAFIQTEIELTKLINFLDGDEETLDRLANKQTREFKTAKQPFMEPLYKDKDKIIDYFNNIKQSLVSALSFDHKPTFEEVMQRIDSYENKRCDNDMGCYIEYQYYLSNINNILANNNTVNVKSDCIALLIHNSIFESMLNYLEENYKDFTVPAYRGYYNMWMKHNLSDYKNML